MKFALGDIFIGDFTITQFYGGNPDVYSRFGLNGHNGIDFGCTFNTQILAANDGWVMKADNDSTGYGHYVKLVHDGYLTLYGHLDHSVVSVGDKVVRGQLIGFSDTSGFATGPHLHFGVAPCDTHGIKTELGNGFSGYIDPNNTERCQWQVRELKAPVDPKVGIPATQSLASTNGQQTIPIVPIPSTGVTDAATLQQAISHLNTALEEARAKMMTANLTLGEYNKQITMLQQRVDQGNVEYNQLSGELLNTKNELSRAKIQLGQAEHDRDVCLQAQGNQNRLMTIYKNTSIKTMNRGAILKAFFSKWFQDLTNGGEKNGNAPKPNPTNPVTPV